MLSQPIAKARAVVAKIQDQDPEEAWQESAEPPPTATPIASPPSEARPEVALSPSRALPEVNSSPSVAATRNQPAEDQKPESAAQPTPVDTKLTNTVSEFLQKAHIGGVRTGQQPKLILNGSGYDQGDLIDPATGLRFLGLRDKKLAFQDAQGTVYVKGF